MNLDNDTSAPRIHEGQMLRHVSMGLLLSLLITVSILGNILVCIAILTDKTLRKLSNLFFVSLAVADLLLSTLVMPFAIVNDLSGEWMFGRDYCNMWIATDVMCCTASIISLLAISLERYIHIKDPLQYTEWLTRKSVPLSIVVIWMTSGLISFLPISLGLHSPVHESLGNDNSNLTYSHSHENNVTTLPLMPYHLLASEGGGNEDFATEDVYVNVQPSKEDINGPQCQVDFSPFYSITSSIVSFFLPCMLMLIIYFHLFAIAKRHVNEMKAHARPVIRLQMINEPADPLNGLPEPHAETPTVKTRRKQVLITLSDSPLIQEHKAAITIGIIMGVFLLCWTPFFIVNVVAGFCKDCISGTTFKVLTWLGYSNSAFNPIIYTIFNAEFRGAFHRVLKNMAIQLCLFFRHSDEDEFKNYDTRHTRC